MYPRRATAETDMNVIDRYYRLPQGNSPVSVRAPTYGAWRLPVKAAVTILYVFLLLAGHQAARASETLSIVVLGDSLSAGYDLPAGAAWPESLGKALVANGHDVTVINAGVSGDTASGGLQRVDWSVADGTDGVILELGANDMLRGVDPDETLVALDGIIERLKERNIAVMLVGMRASPALGPEYQEKYDALFPALAEKHGLVFYPFFLDGIAAEPALNLGDGIHPNEEGVAVIVERSLPTVEAFIAQIRDGK